jgi:DNA-binding NtrC family response regulator
MPDAPTVLVVDDEEAVLSLLEGLLTAEGHGVVRSSSGERALELADNTTIDVALVDKNLPDMDGVELVRRLVERRPEIGAAIMTGLGSLRSSLDDMRAGVKRYLLKPFDDAAVVTRTVRELVPRQQTESSARIDGGSDDPVRVIVADASDKDRDEITAAFEDVGCQVAKATCAQEALLQLAAGEHDLIVVAYDMGDMTADDVLLRAKRVNKHVAVVVTSANPTLPMTAALMRRGAAALLAKPLKDRRRSALAAVGHARASRDRARESVEKAKPPSAPAVIVEASADASSRSRPQEPEPAPPAAPVADEPKVETEAAASATEAPAAAAPDGAEPETETTEAGSAGADASAAGPSDEEEE